MKFRCLLILALLLWVSAAHAQVPNCSGIQYQSNGRNYSSQIGCSSIWTWVKPDHYDVTWHFTWQCYTKYPLAQTIYATGSRDLTSMGSCYNTGYGSIKYCDPIFKPILTVSALPQRPINLFGRGRCFPDCKKGKT